MKKIIERAVMLLATTALVLGLIPQEVFAGEDYELVPVDGQVIDLTDKNHKHLNMTRSGAGCSAFTVKECPDYSTGIMVPAKTTDYEVTIPVTMDGVYDISIINADKLKFTVTNGDKSSYEGSDIKKDLTYSVKKGTGIKFKFTNTNDIDKKVSILVTPNNTIYCKNSVAKLVVGKETRFDLRFTNLPQGEYAFKVQFYTDETFTKINKNGAFSWSKMISSSNKDGYYDIKSKNDIVSGLFKPNEKAYIIASLVKVTDISDYDTVENNDAFVYHYTVKESGVYMAYRAYNVGTSDYHFTRSFNQQNKGTVLESRNFTDLGLSYVSYKKLSDISSYSGVKDKFDVIDNSYLFCPKNTDDYYFTSSTPLHYLVTDLSTGESVECDNSVGAHLEKDKKYAVSVSIIKGSRQTYEVKICKKIEKTKTPTPSVPSNSGNLQFGDFVERLYLVALNRPSEKEGKDYWCEHVGNGDLTGAACAKSFLLSEEFNNRHLDDSEFLKVLYKTFFDRNAEDDPNGFNFWLDALKTQGRDSVVNGFINSTEWCNICATYGVTSGAQYAKSTIASANSIAFATRLYTECLGRDPETEGLNYWSLGLTNQELTGTQAAKEFFYSPEYLGKNLDDSAYIDTLYKTFMGREPETDGKTYWLDQLKNGTSRDDVFTYFSICPEFTGICQKYGIQR